MVSVNPVTAVDWRDEGSSREGLAGLTTTQASGVMPLRRADTPIGTEQKPTRNPVTIAVHADHVHPARVALHFQKQLFKPTEPLLISVLK